MSFRKYDHVERLGHQEVEGIDIGLVDIFPKLDGTNASLWCFEQMGEGGMEPDFFEIHAGSRNRQITMETDNGGFHAWLREREKTHPLFVDLFTTHPDWILYGEWLIPHTLKTYRDEAWKRFWVFDVWDRKAERYLSFGHYAPTLRFAGLDVVEPLCSIESPSPDQLQRELAANTYLIQDGCGAGEGIVLKNYAWTNQFGRQPWAKVVRTEFKEDNKRAFGTPVKGGERQVELEIAERYCTAGRVAKIRAQIIHDTISQLSPMPLLTDYDEAARRVEEEYRGQIIPRLLQTVYTDIVREECWTFVRELKDPTINFKRLRAACVQWTKKHAADLF